MSIHRLFGDKSIIKSMMNSERSLRVGDVIQGKVAKLYPNHKAQINLSGNQMIAQLQAPLTIGERYHFQVEKTDNQILHLKVLGESVKQNSQQVALQLINQLGIKATNHSIALMQSFINNDLPFTRNTFMQAVQLLQSKEIPITQQISILNNMIEKKLPISQVVFQSLAKVQSGGVSETIAGVITQASQQNMNYSPLLHQLERVSNGFQTENISFVKYAVAEANNSDSKMGLFPVLQKLGFISPSITRSEWNQVMTSLEKLPTSFIDGRPLPFSVEPSSIIRQAEQLLAKESQILDATRSLLQGMGSFNAKQRMNLNQLSAMQNLTNLLPESMVSQLSKETKLSTQPTVSKPFVETLNNPNIFRSLEQMVQTIQSSVLPTLAQSDRIKQMFLQQVQWMNQFSGITYENQLANGGQDINNVKAQILQLLQSSDGLIHERGQQLLHHLQGIQLNSVTESDGFLQAFLQIPAHKLGLAKDINLQFQSKKSKDGTIDPEFCRVLFYLELHSLKDTVIDMNVQNRNVTVTIYNDSPSLAKLTKPMQPLLQEGLEHMDYNLSSVHVKPFESMNTNQKVQSHQTHKSSYQGVDFRV